MPTTFCTSNRLRLNTRLSGVLMAVVMLTAASGITVALARSLSASGATANVAMSRVVTRTTPQPGPEELAAAQMTPAPTDQSALAQATTTTAPPEAVGPVASTISAAGVYHANSLLGRGAIPVGKGMWLYLPERVEGGDVDALVARATQVGLTHIYVRTGSSRSGFYAGPYLDQLLGKAHAGGIRVYGWDFPYLEDVNADVARAMSAMLHTTPDGHRIDGFAPDIETPSEGTNLSAETAGAYSAQLRASVGAGYPLIAVVPRPSAHMKASYPYQAIVPHYDAVAPMVYWLNRQPDTDAGPAVAFFRDLFAKPVIPVGQAYDGGPEGGRPGPPPPDEISRFLVASEDAGAIGASFWSWQHADQPIWDAIQTSPQFLWEAKLPDVLRPSQIRALQVLLAQLGYGSIDTGVWDDATTAAVSAFQQSHAIAATGMLDPATIAALLMPITPPLS